MPSVLQMEVGIEDCLHIEFEYDRASYHLTDVVMGKIYFLLVRIKLKHMELEIRRRETSGGGTAARVDTETVAKYEIMDGAPVRGEVIPIRLYLEPYDLTPTYPNVHNKFSVKYFLNLVLVDDEDRRYFKQQEIELFRAPDGTAAGQGSGTGAGLRRPVLTSSVVSPLRSMASSSQAGDGGSLSPMSDKAGSSSGAVAAGPPLSTGKEFEPEA